MYFYRSFWRNSNLIDFPFEILLYVILKKFFVFSFASKQSNIVWSQTNQEFKTKTMRDFFRLKHVKRSDWKIFYAEQEQKMVNSTEISERMSINWMHHTCGHVHGNRLCATENKSHTKYECARRFRVYFIFFFSKIKREKKNLYCFPDFRVFFISTNVSLCTLIKKYTLNRTNNHGQRRWQNTKRKKNNNNNESVQHLFK